MVSSANFWQIGVLVHWAWKTAFHFSVNVKRKEEKIGRAQMI
jgi:hypothetical protein